MPEKFIVFRINPPPCETRKPQASTVISFAVCGFSLHCDQDFRSGLRSRLWAGLWPRHLKTAASDRTSWRALIRKAANAFQDDRRQRLTAGRDRRHRAASAAVLTAGVPCLTCSRICASGATCVSTDEAERIVFLGTPRDNQ